MQENQRPSLTRRARTVTLLALTMLVAFVAAVSAAPSGGDTTTAAAAGAVPAQFAPVQETTPSDPPADDAQPRDRDCPQEGGAGGTGGGTPPAAGAEL